MNNIDELLKQLAHSLGTTVEYLWGIMLRQAIISAIHDIIWIVIFAICTVLFAKWHIKNLKNPNDEYSTNYYDRDDWRGIVGVILAIIWVVFLVVIISLTYDLMNALFNPEYWAFTELMKSLKGLIGGTIK